MTDEDMFMKTFIPYVNRIKLVLYIKYEKDEYEFSFCFSFLFFFVVFCVVENKENHFYARNKQKTCKINRRWQLF